MIGIYGDSFADINPKELVDVSIDRMPWPMHLAQVLNDDFKSYAQSATSIWWSYKKFINTYKKYDTIVFCYSNHNRWSNINYVPHTFDLFPDKQIGLTHIFYEDQLEMLPDDMKPLAKMLVDIHPFLYDEKLQLFLYQHVFNSVNELCKLANIKLVNLMPFEHFNADTISINTDDASGSVLTNLNRVSRSEFYMRIQQFEVPRHYLLKELKGKPDGRFCHINPHNNKILATIIKEALDNKTDMNLGLDPRFSYDFKHLKYLL